MKIISILFLIAIFKSHLCEDIKDVFENINKKVENFNAIAADIAWEYSVNPGNTKLPYMSAKYQMEQIKWQQNTCDELTTLNKRHSFNSSQERQTYLVCRGPKYTFREARIASKLYEEVQTIYSDAEVCIPTDQIVSPRNLTEIEGIILEFLTTAKHYSKIEYFKDPMIGVKAAVNNQDKRALCLKGEDDFEKLMAFSRNEDVLSWLWLAWREKVGPPMKEPYRKMVNVENVAARRNGYSDIGASWRDEQEMPNVRQKCRRLYERIRPLYTLLHGVVRFYLRKKYGDIVPETGPIPAHLLGNLWSQNWEPISDLIIPTTIDIDAGIKKLNWTVEHMVQRAEDFYQSLGLPPMTDNFWHKSILAKDDNTRCHGTAADMFKDKDFRLLYCSGTTKEDFYVLHHELGHIQYYMAYERQPALFRQANTAMHEAIGDTIMYGVTTPQHLHRLGLINDTVLYGTNEYIKDADETFMKINEMKSTKQSNDGIATKGNDNGKEDFMTQDLEANIEEIATDFDKLHLTTDEELLLKQALNKIPQIPFSLLVDEYRWKYFEGDFTNFDLNKEFWQMALELQGVAPTVERGIEYFDVGAKFHVTDNTPYIRYFLSSFIQHQLFESLCKAAVFGRRGITEPLPKTITMNRCDIYGSKTAGKILKDIMSRGHSQHWQRILHETIGEDDISPEPLERYYRPLYKILTKLVRIHRIPIGW